MYPKLAEPRANWGHVTRVTGCEMLYARGNLSPCATVAKFPEPNSESWQLPDFEHHNTYPMSYKKATQKREFGEVRRAIQF